MKRSRLAVLTGLLAVGLTLSTTGVPASAAPVAPAAFLASTAPLAPTAPVAQSASSPIEHGVEILHGAGEAAVYWAIDYVYHYVVDLIHRNANRSGVLTGVAYSAFYKGHQKVNVIVINHDEHYHWHVYGLKYRAIFHFDGYPPLDLVVFKGRGHVHNYSDGGYINWHLIHARSGHWANRQHHNYIFGPAVR